MHQGFDGRSRRASRFAHPGSGGGTAETRRGTGCSIGGETWLVLTCPEHDQEKLQFYCRSCQRLLCPLCKLRRIHTGHKILPVAQAYQALKEKITKEMNYILSNQDTVLAQITQLESSITQTEVNSVSARK
ncbi:tripartite motif-containing protein 46-like [Pelmatolapia mariae]|uniref:tripartite motif-containing protein 46-like n=1 Tax=Pelmatolapia mariae TaxID=158779 RepID=UPI003211D9AC